MIYQFLSELKRKKQVNILIVLLLFSVFCLLLVMFRMYYTKLITFQFLLWNLFLAWIPYGISLLLIAYEKQMKSKFLISFLLIIWLLFLPNSPYIITDLYHFNKKIYVPLWYDLILILSFAWTGIFLGFLSLANVQSFIAHQTNTIFSWFFAFATLCLTAFGIYLGRYLRWNSWSILTQPESLFSDIINRILYPLAYKETVAMTILFSAFLIIAYLTLKVLINPNIYQKRA